MARRPSLHDLSKDNHHLHTPPTPIVIPNTTSYRSSRPPPLSPTDLDKTPTPNYYRPGSPESPEVPQPFFNYNYDRIQNDLLDEICDEIGIKDATDLDFMDFEPPGEDLLPRGPMCDEMDNLDQLILFGQMDQNGQAQPEAANQSHPATAESGGPVWQVDGDQSVPGSPYHNNTPVYTSAPSSPVKSTSSQGSGNCPGGYARSPSRNGCPGSPKPETTWKQVQSPQKPVEVSPPEDPLPEEPLSHDHMTDDYKIASPRKNRPDGTRLSVAQPTAASSHHDDMLRMAIAQDRKNTQTSSVNRNPPSVSQSDGGSIGSPHSLQEPASPASQPPCSPASPQGPSSPSYQRPASPLATQTSKVTASQRPRSPVVAQRQTLYQSHVASQGGALQGHFAAPEHLPPGKERSMLRAKSIDVSKKVAAEKMCGARNQESPFDQGYFSVGSMSGSHDGSNNDVPPNSGTPPLTLDQQSADDKVLDFLNNTDSTGARQLRSDLNYRNMMTDDALLMRARQVKQEEAGQSDWRQDDPRSYHENRGSSGRPVTHRPPQRPNVAHRGNFSTMSSYSPVPSPDFVEGRIPDPKRAEMTQGVRMGSQGFVYQPTDASISFTSSRLDSGAQDEPLRPQRHYMSSQSQFGSVQGGHTTQPPSQLNQNFFTMPATHSTPSVNCAPYPRTRSGSNPSSPKKQRLNYHPSQYAPTTPVTFNHTPAQFAAPSYNSVCGSSVGSSGGQGTPMYRMGGQPSFRPPGSGQHGTPGQRGGPTGAPQSLTTASQPQHSKQSQMFAPMPQQSLGQAQMGMHSLNSTMASMVPDGQFQTSRQTQGENFQAQNGVQSITQQSQAVQPGPQSHMTPGNFSGMMPESGASTPQNGSNYLSPGGVNGFNQLSPGGLMGGLPAGAAKYGFMQQLISDRSNAFRSHPLFPLLRDLIIADMNFASPTFPFQLIANLPVDFDKLLSNYFQRNPLNAHYEANEAVEKVIIDALRYAHKALIEKITQRKQKEGIAEPKSFSAIEDFCQRFDQAVKNTMTKNSGQSPAVQPTLRHGSQPPNNACQPSLVPRPTSTIARQPPTNGCQPSLVAPTSSTIAHQTPMATRQYSMTNNSSMTLSQPQPSVSVPQTQPMGMPQYSSTYGQSRVPNTNYDHSHHFPNTNNNSMMPLSSGMEQNCMPGDMKSSGEMNHFGAMSYRARNQPPQQVPLCTSTPVPNFVSSSGINHRLTNSSTPPLPNSPHKGLMNPSLSAYHRTGSDCSLNSVKSNGSCSSVRSDPGSGNHSTTNSSTNRKQVLPKEAVAIMLEWLRDHRDNPYPNDDEKYMLIQQTRLTMAQINYWFTNARRRILPKWTLQRLMEEKARTTGKELTPEEQREILSTKLTPQAVKNIIEGHTIKKHAISDTNYGYVMNTIINQ